MRCTTPCPPSSRVEHGLHVVGPNEGVAEPVDLADEAQTNSFACSPEFVNGAQLSTRPSSITTSWPATSIASSCWCVTKIVVTCISSCRLRSQARRSLRTLASSAPNGSLLQ